MMSSPSRRAPRELRASRARSPDFRRNSRMRSRMLLLFVGLVTSAAALTHDASAAPKVATHGGADTLASGAFDGLEFRSIGPALMSGRVIDIAVDPTDRYTWYVAAASGGVWKTTNAGNTWKPVFDDQGSYSIGCVTVDPHRPLTVWVGSGE